MLSNLMETFLGLLIALKALGFFQRRLKRVKRQLSVAKGTNALDGFHHGLIPERGEVLRINLLETQLASPAFCSLSDPTSDEVRRCLQSLPRLIGPGHSFLRRF